MWRIGTWKCFNYSFSVLLVTTGEDVCGVNSYLTTHLISEESKCLSFDVSLFFFLLFRAAPMTYGSFQARGQIGAIAAGLRQSNSRSELCLWPTPQLTAMLDPQPTGWGQGLNPHPHGYQSGLFLLNHSGNSLMSLDITKRLVNKVFGGFFSHGRTYFKMGSCNWL